jgi:hypothetical protein
VSVALGLALDTHQMAYWPQRDISQLAACHGQCQTEIETITSIFIGVRVAWRNARVSHLGVRLVLKIATNLHVNRRFLCRLRLRSYRQ